MKMSSQMLLGIADLPNRPALYALYGGTGRHAYVAYVGITDKLKRRVAQHLLTRDSSAAAVPPRVPQRRASTPTM
jgi:excinuclease UvrABC nuclease subunit